MSILESQNDTAQRVESMSSRSGVERKPQHQAQQQFWESQRQQIDALQPESGRNVGSDERAVSVAAGAILGLLGLSRRSLPGLITAGVGAMLVERGITGKCSLYNAMGISTTPHPGQSPRETNAAGVSLAAAVTINKPREELYKFWRNFENLPTFMEYLQAVRVTDDRHSHWTAKAPALLGGKVEWDAEITRDDPNELIEWRSLSGSTIDTTGQVRFQDALGDRGTEVHVWMNYDPPGGRLGHWAASLLGENPRRVIREALHNFKRLMELGEIITIIGQSHGTCLGQGKPYKESRWKPLFT